MNPGIMKLIPDTNPPRYPLILRPIYIANWVDIGPGSIWHNPIPFSKDYVVINFLLFISSSSNKEIWAYGPPKLKIPIFIKIFAIN